MAAMATAWQAWFGFLLVLHLLALVILTRIWQIPRLLGLLSKRTAEDCCVCTGVLLFRSLLMLNPQIRVKASRSMADWAKLCDGAAPFILMNHTSFLDFFVFTSAIPIKVVFRRHLRTMMAESLLRIPLVGESFVHTGAFAVYFRALADKSKGLTGGDSTDFGVDRDKQAAEADRIDAHLSAGGGLCLCPEGTVSKSPPALQLFRKGSFVQSVKHGMQVWGVTMLGCYECWPKRASMGGLPCVIDISLLPLELPGVPADAAPEAVAGACQAKMQAEVDRLVALRVACDQRSK